MTQILSINSHIKGDIVEYPLTVSNVTELI